ncbi:MAG: DNA repair protein RecO [Betaproteobacteria bacterium]|nr:DNA repair protein RecO [Betaproteobacteria bacterium]
MHDGTAGTATVAGPRGVDNLRVSNDPAFVLHTRPWKETSLVLELLTRSRGRVAAVAKGARRPHSQLRALLLPFQPLLVTYSGKGELRLVHGVEWVGGIPQLGGVALMCGFYLNELVMTALVRDDPHETLFDAYLDTVRDLGTARFHSGVLRRFECTLLEELGYGLILDTDAESGERVDESGTYCYVPERGPVRVRDDGDSGTGAIVSGKTLLDIARAEYTDPATLAESKRLMRSLINYHLGRPELHSRQLLSEMRGTP